MRLLSKHGICMDDLDIEWKSPLILALHFMTKKIVIKPENFEISSSPISLWDIDLYGKNIFHYLPTNTNFMFFLNHLGRFNSDVLLKAPDLEGNLPIDYLLHSRFEGRRTRRSSTLLFTRSVYFR